MVKKISGTGENRKENILDRFKPLEMPNGNLTFLLTQSNTLVCESVEQRHNKSIKEFEKTLGVYSFLKELPHVKTDLPTDVDEIRKQLEARGKEIR